MCIRDRYKLTTQCRKCKKWGHWESDHNDDGSLKPGAVSNDGPMKTDKAEKKGVITFGMVKLCDQACDSGMTVTPCGPLLDDGAPYSGLGTAEFHVLQPEVLPEWNQKFDPIPESVKHTPYWQYGTGSHASQRKRIVGSVLLTARCNDGTLIQIRHLLIEGSSPWVIGRNVTRKCNILHAEGDLLQVPVVNSNSVSLSLLEHELHSYIPSEAFHSKTTAGSSKRLFCATANLQEIHADRPWSEIKKIVDKVHKHVCGHASYTDIKTLLERNKLWNPAVHKYLSTTVERCPSCNVTAEPKQERQVSLSTLNRSLNDVVCIDHLFLGNCSVIHIMDTATRYSVGQVVPDTSMTAAVLAFEAGWISQFWAPSNVVFDRAFENEEFRRYLSLHEISARDIPPRRHNKNALESKHRVLRDIFLRLKHERQQNGSSSEKSLSSSQSDESNDDTIHDDLEPLLIQQAFRISNDLYGSDTVSAYEMAKGYTRPVLSAASPVPLPKELVDAHDALIARRRLTKILKSKSVSDAMFAVGDLVEVFIKKGKEKRGKWSTSKSILTYDHPSRTVTVAGKNGRVISAAIEDVRPAITENEFSLGLQEAMNELDDIITDTIQHQESCLLYTSQSPRDKRQSRMPSSA